MLPFFIGYTNHLTYCLAIMGAGGSVLINYLKLCIAYGESCSTAYSSLVFFFAIKHVGLEVGDGQQRTGLRHAKKTFQYSYLSSRQQMIN